LEKAVKNMGGVPKMVGFPPKSSILIGFSIINHPFWGTPIFGNTHMEIQTFSKWFLRIHMLANVKKSPQPNLFVTREW